MLVIGKCCHAQWARAAHQTYGTTEKQASARSSATLDWLCSLLVSCAILFREKCKPSTSR